MERVCLPQSFYSTFCPWLGMMISAFGLGMMLSFPYLLMK